MNLSWKLGRVAGIDLFLHPTFLMLLLFVGATQGGILAVLVVAAVFGCVLLHELGHALTARLYGIATEDIALYPIGGVARLTRMPRKPGPELVIALAGPAVNLAIAAALATLMKVGLVFDPSWRSESIMPGILSLLWTYNLMLAGFNLIPAFPMDGGRVFRPLLSGWLGRVRATEIAAGLGRCLALGFGLWSLLGGNLLQAVLAGFIFLAAGAELASVRNEERRWGAPRPWEGYAPAGQRWIYVGDGLWRLAPIGVPVPAQQASSTWA